MFRWWGWMGIMLCLTAGCARLGLNENEVISQYLPLAIRDIEEIRVGDEDHKKLFESQGAYQEPHYKLYTSPELHAYVSYMGMRIARNSQRPNLPYRFFILDSDQVDIFGLGGGRVYVTRGFFTFITSEAELAGGLAHEIGHIANYHYTHVQESKLKKGYQLLMKVTDETRMLTGHYGSAAYKGLTILGNTAPYVKRKFEGDFEKQADRDAVLYMTRAGYDPNGLCQLVEKLSKVKVEDVGSFVDYMKGHSPSQKRRMYLMKIVGKSKFTPKPRFQIRNDQLKILVTPAISLTSTLDMKSPPVKEVRGVSSDQKDLRVVETAALPATHS